MGYSTLYAHNRYYFPDAGDEVEEGEIIALSGDSGDTTGPHLHYEIRLNGKPVDPMKYLDLGE
jgi:murein DD-endopeptidase MepM/ murein hydrolase activator NlpD